MNTDSRKLIVTRIILREAINSISLAEKSAEQERQTILAHASDALEKARTHILEILK